MKAIKVGSNRQVAIPKIMYDALDIRPGDYLEVELQKGRLILTPKTLVDRNLENVLSKATEEVTQEGV